jgi:hypothetical protein
MRKLERSSTGFIHLFSFASSKQNPEQTDKQKIRMATTVVFHIT